MPIFVVSIRGGRLLIDKIDNLSLPTLPWTKIYCQL
jgi:hypothetical protein